MPANDPLPAHLTAPGAVEHHHYTPTTRQVQKAVHQYLEEPANDAKIRDLIRKRIDEAVEVGVHVYLGSTPFEAMVTRAVAIYMRGNLEGHPTEMGAAEGLKALIQGELRTLIARDYEVSVTKKLPAVSRTAYVAPADLPPESPPSCHFCLDAGKRPCGEEPCPICG